MKPNALIIGTAKAGSTSLYQYLSSNPEVFGSKQKELMYFSRDFHKGVEWYTSNFPEKPRAKIYFEATPQYSFRDEFPEAAARIRDFNPDMKIIYTVRDPLSRIVSHFNQWKRIWPDRYTDFEATMKKPKQRKLFLDRTKYFHQISRYCDLFPREQICLVFIEDIIRNPTTTLNGVFEFLGVKQTADKINTKAYGKGADRTHEKQIKVEDVSSTLKDEIIEELRDDIRNFLSFAGKPAEFWDKGYI